VDRRNVNTLVLALCTLVAPTNALPQGPSTPRRLGALIASNPAVSERHSALLDSELRRLGWVEGRNLSSVYRFAAGDVSRFDALAAELVALKPDVLFSWGTPGTVALQRATQTIPIVMAGPADPVALGLVKSLARPGGNLTGITIDGGLEVEAKRLQLLKELVPGMSRVTLIYNPADPGAPLRFAGVRDAARVMNVQVESLVVRDSDDIEPMLSELSRRKPDAVYVFATTAITANREAVCAGLAKLRLPSSAALPPFVNAGCLMTYSSSDGEIAHQVATYIDQILRGANPADLPVRQPSRYELVLNAQTAKAIGLTISSKFKVRADRVIE